MNILLLEDDIALNKAIKKVLELDDHVVDTCLDGQTLLESLVKIYDLYVLDINVPHISGLELLDIILFQNDQAKVIMISSNTDVNSLQAAYKLGCVDYLKKPFHLTELRAKVNRLKILREDIFSAVRLKRDSEGLTKKEKRFLHLLLENSPLVVRYEVIGNYVYENKAMSMNALRALVRRLRGKMEDDIIQNNIEEGYSISNISSTENEHQKEDVTQKLKALEEENKRLKLDKEILIKKSTVDPLTGLYNRVKIEEIFLLEQQQFIRYGDPLSIILMDLDYFKTINDVYGHNTGDRYLQELAKILMAFSRSSDIVGRWGGEEFLILLPRCTLDKAKEAAIRLKDAIHEMDCPKIGRRTASFGLSILNEEDTLNSFVNRADKALFLAKAGGRNRVEVYVQ